MPGVFPNLPKAGPQTSTGNICKTHNNLGKNDWVYDPQRSRDANVGIYPYKYVCRNGQERVFLGLSTYKAYQPVEGNRDTWELEAFAYGEFFGWSNSHFDARSIIPLNGDKIKSVKEIEYNLTKYPPYDKDARNNMNYIWCGAGNASCTFDTELNRFKLSHLYTETRLSKLNAGTTASTQIGEQEIVFNKEENATIFYPDLDINEPPFVNNIGLTATTFYNKANQGIQDAQSGCFLRNIWLPGENWKPPPGVNLQNYISPKVEYENDGDINMGGNPMWSNSQVDISGTRYIDGTKRNRDLIIADLTEASEEMWDGCLLSRCGFTYRDLMPYAGKQDNRFSEFTYGSSNLDLQNSGTKPFLQNTQSDTATNISLSTTITDGTPTFEIGFFNNEPVSVNGLNPGTLAASSIPQLVSCPFYIILSSICETQFQAGDIPQNTICVGQKNYSQGDFFYIQANSYKQLIDMDRTLTEISQEIRNPLTGRLARLGPASCIVYRIERDIFVPLATTDVDGDAVGQPKEHTEGVENTHAISNLLDYTPQDIGVEERAGGAVRVSDPLTTGGSRLMTAPLHEVRREPGYASIISHDDAEQRRLFEKARVSVRGLQESYNEQQQQKGAPELDNDLLYNSLMKLAIQKALANLPVIARHNEILNPKIISLSINKVFEELTEDMAKFKNKEGEIEPKKIMEALRTKDVYISRDGRVVTKRSWKANYAGQVKGRYSISPEVENKMAEILKQGGDITNEIRQAITEKQFTYTPAKWDKSEGQQPFTDTQGMYDYSDKISGISLAARRDKDRAHREANPALQDARNRARRGGTPEERKEARAMARRHISDYYGDDWTKKDLDREIASANRAPVRYMQEHSGGGGGGKEEKGGEKSSVKERADKHRKMEEEAAAESVRGKLVKKE
jgi:hypothetical protein